MNKLYFATDGHRFQISTDGYGPYQAAIPLTFQFDVDFAQLIKRFGKSDDDERRYSPAKIIAAKKTKGCGNPDPERVCTSHVERGNLSMRMAIRRLTRLTNAHSKKWANHEAMLGLYFAWFNFCRLHSSLGKQTPAQAHGLAERGWTISELLDAAG